MSSDGEKNSPKGRFAFRAGTVIVSTLFGIVLGTVSSTAQNVVDSVIPSDALADRLRPGDQDLIIQVDPFYQSRNSGQVAFRDAPALSQEELAVVNSGDDWGNAPGVVDTYWDVVTKHGGYPVDFAPYYLTLIGNLEQRIRVTDVRVVVDKREPVLSGGLFCNSLGGGDAPPIPASFDLDNAKPEFLTLNETGEFTPFSSSRVVTLDRKESVTFYVDPRLTKDLVHYHLVIDYRVGNEKKQRSVYDATGAPFGVTALADVKTQGGGFSTKSYRELYTTGADGKLSKILSDRPDCVG